MIALVLIAAAFGFFGLGFWVGYWIGRGHELELQSREREREERTK